MFDKYFIPGPYMMNPISYVIFIEGLLYALRNKILDII